MSLMAWIPGTAAWRERRAWARFARKWAARRAALRRAS